MGHFRASASGSIADAPPAQSTVYAADRGMISTLSTPLLAWPDPPFSPRHRRAFTLHSTFTFLLLVG